MARWGWGLLGGLLGAGVVVGVLAYRKDRELRLRAVALRASLEAGGGALEQTMLIKGRSVQTALRAEGEHLATSLAEEEGQRVLGVVYGFTPARVERLQRLVARLPGGG